MKLNNRGWGTKEMILLSGGLFLALIVAIYFIVKLFGSFDSAVLNRQYADLEIKIEEAARNYIVNNNINVNGEYRISLDTLKNNNYITDFKDNNGSNCSGYVKVTKVDGINQYAGYISCFNYQTRNY